MGCKRNKRTLKKRVRRVMSICIFLTIFLFGLTVMVATARTFKTEAEFLSKYFSNSVVKTMTSDYFLSQMNIKDLRDFDKNSPAAQKWLQSLQDSEKSVISDESLVFILNDKTFDLSSENMIRTQIELNGKTIYSSDEFHFNTELSQSADGVSGHDTAFLKRLMKFYGASSHSDLYDLEGNNIGRVTVEINAVYPLVLQITILLIVVFVGLLLLVVINFISKFLSISVTRPLKQLEDKTRAIAAGNYESTINSQITLKRPLREIESLAFSTNLIIQKTKEYNDLLEKQKVLLENQNEELEAQNEELTESKRKIEEAQTLLVQSQNMASIGQLTAAITHEINTPLGAINSNVQIFEMFIATLLENSLIEADNELSGLAGQMKETNQISMMACQRVSDIIKSLKNFTRIDQAEFQEADLNEGVRSVLILTSNLWKRKIKMHEEYGSLPKVKCYPGLLNQVYMNIVVNAIQSIEEKGEIFIRTYIEGDSFACVSIRDTGSGIEEGNLERIFESGFSTKSCGVGAGLGLSICRNIIEKHNGEIRVSSKPGEGTEFVVCIPLNL